MILIKKNNCIITRLFTFKMDSIFSLFPFFFSFCEWCFHMGPNVLQNIEINIRLKSFWTQWIRLKSLVIWKAFMNHSCYNQLLDANAMKRATGLSFIPQVCPAYRSPIYWQIGRTLLNVHNRPCHSTGPTTIYQFSSSCHDLYYFQQVWIL